MNLDEHTERLKYSCDGWMKVGGGRVHSGPGFLHSGSGGRQAIYQRYYSGMCIPAYGSPQGKGCGGGGSKAHLAIQAQRVQAIDFCTAQKYYLLREAKSKPA